MRPLHLLHSKADANSSYVSRNFIQIKSGRVNVIGYGGTTVVSLPVQDVFGDVFTADDEFYICSELFKDTKAYSATWFRRDGDTITPYFSDTKEGFPIKLLKPEDLERSYPDINAVLPLKYAPVDKAGIDAPVIASIQKILKATYVKMIFHGPKYGYTIKDVQSSNEGFGFVSPVLFTEEDVKDYAKEHTKEPAKEDDANGNAQEEDDLLG